MSDAYDTVEFKPSWLGCSLLAIALLVLIGVALPFVIGSRFRSHFWELLVLFPLLSLLGTFTGIMALRRSSSRSLAGVVLIANATVLGSCLVALLFVLVR